MITIIPRVLYNLIKKRALQAIAFSDLVIIVDGETSEVLVDKNGKNRTILTEEIADLVNQVLYYKGNSSEIAT